MASKKKAALDRQRRRMNVQRIIFVVISIMIILVFVLGMIVR